MIELVKGAPLVLKLLEGTQGVGVVMAETNKAAESVIEECTHKDVAGRVIEFIEKHAVRGKNKTKGKG